MLSVCLRAALPLVALQSQTIYLIYICLNFFIYNKRMVQIPKS